MEKKIQIKKQKRSFANTSDFTTTKNGASEILNYKKRKGSMTNNKKTKPTRKALTMRQRKDIVT